MHVFRAVHVTLFPWPPFHIDGQGYYSQGCLQYLSSVIGIMPSFHLIASYLDTGNAVRYPNCLSVLQTVIFMISTSLSLFLKAEVC
jgi:hypothetical protein